jgi:galactitol-specific phosphotransferase system IIB component
MKKIIAKIILTDGSIETIDYGKLISCEINNLGVSDVRKPSFGIIVPNGRIEFFDVNGVFLSKVNSGLANDARVKFYYKDTSSQEEQFLASFLCKKWDYDKANKKMRGTLYSAMEKTKDIIVPTEELDARIRIEELSIIELLQYVQKYSKLTEYIDYYDDFVAIISSRLKKVVLHYRSRYIF